MEALKAHILSLVTTVTGLVVGFGVISETTAGSIIGVAAVVVSAAFEVANAVHVKAAHEHLAAVESAKITAAH